MPPDASIGGWAQIFTGLDVATMMGIGILAFVMTRSMKLTEQHAMLIPTSLGLVYGILDAWTKSEAGAPMSQLVMLAFKGLIFNGAGATLVGRVTAIAVERWWPSPAGEVKALAVVTAQALVNKQSEVAREVALDTARVLAEKKANDPNDAFPAPPAG